MGIVIGIAGAHRVGKSTLCKELEGLGVGLYKYASTDLTSVLEKHKTTAVELQKRPINEFLAIQYDILNKIIETIKECRNRQGVFVVDRTPIDALAYLWSNFNATDFESLYYNRIDSEENIKKIYTAIDAYKKTAFEACQDELAMIFLVQPGIEIVAEKGKALPDTHYQDQLNRFMLGDLHSVQEELLDVRKSRGYRWVKIMPRTLTDIQKRVLFVDKHFSSNMFEQMHRNSIFKISGE